MIISGYTHNLFFPCTERRVCVCFCAPFSFGKVCIKHFMLVFVRRIVSSIAHSVATNDYWPFPLDAFTMILVIQLNNFFFLSRTLLLCKMRAYACYSFQVLYSTSWRRKKTHVKIYSTLTKHQKNKHIANGKKWNILEENAGQTSK